ncbi:MAG: flavodoxin family protein [Nitrososphaerales archaeon]
MLIVYFSWTGNTRAVAEEVVRNLALHNEVDVCEIQPKKQRGYLGWLLLSLIPRSRVRIKPSIYDLSGYDLVVLGSPKWALSCPPVNEYLNRLHGCIGRMAAVFITYGGFDEKRYLDRLVKALEKKGLLISGTLMTRRRSIRNDEYQEDVKIFCEDLERAADRKRLIEVA